MLGFIISNASTIIISALLAAAVAAIVIRGVMKLRRGQCAGCSCGCGRGEADCGRSDDCGRGGTQS
jgi:hypothetical protein